MTGNSVLFVNKCPSSGKTFDTVRHVPRRYLEFLNAMGNEALEAIARIDVKWKLVDKCRGLTPSQVGEICEFIEKEKILPPCARSG